MREAPSAMAPPDAQSRRDLSRLPMDRDGFRLRGGEMTRVETFTDAAFAFAVTLLVISIDQVPTSFGQLATALEDVPAFGLSFLQLMIFWYAHWRWSRRYGLDDTPTMVLSAALVFIVLVYVYPLKFMFSLMVSWLSGGALGSVTLSGYGELYDVFAVYGVGFCAMSLMIVLLNLHGVRSADTLGLDELERFEARAEIAPWLILTGCGGLVVALAVLTPPHPAVLPGWAFMLVPAGTWGYEVLHRRRRARLLESGGLGPRAVACTAAVPGPPVRGRP